jgi:O-antigen/teichoic acid export membrane protein
MRIINSKRENVNVLIYMLTDILAKGVPFLLLPIYTFYLTPEQFGNISVFNVIVEICIIFVVFGANSYYRVEYFKNVEKHSLFSTLFSNILVCIPAALVLMTVFIYFELNPSNQSNLWLYSAVFIAISQSYILMFVANFQCQGKAGHVGAINLSSALMAAGITSLLLYSGLSEESRYWGFVIASCTALLLATVLYRKSELEWPSFSSVISMPGLRFGLGVLPHALSWWARTGMDRFIIAKFVSLSQVGLYSIAAQLSLIIIVVSNAVNQAFTPKLMKMLAANKHQQTLFLCLKVISIYFVICLGLVIVSPLIFDWFINEKFAGAMAFVPLMCVVAFFQATVTLLSNILYFFKQVKVLSIITFTTSLLHVFIAYYVAEGYGVDGVIYSSIATYMISTISILTISIKLLRKETDAKT